MTSIYFSLTSTTTASVITGVFNSIYFNMYNSVESSPAFLALYFCLLHCAAIIETASSSHLGVSLYCKLAASNLKGKKIVKLKSTIISYIIDPAYSKESRGKTAS